jgi:hypothetical protein
MEVSLPSEYRAFLARHGSFEGFLTGEASPSYIELWSLDDLPDNNRDIQIAEYAPGFLAFASDGGGEVLAFDATGAVYMLPLIGMAPEAAMKLTGNFSELADRFELAT